MYISLNVCRVMLRLSNGGVVLSEIFRCGLKIPQNEIFGNKNGGVVKLS